MRNHKMKKSAPLKIERKSSIESEPRTLSLDQIQYARDAALYVMNTKSIEEALRIFTEGLQPVFGARQKEEEMVDPMADIEEEWDYAAAAHLNRPHIARDVVSAPF